MNESNILKSDQRQRAWAWTSFKNRQISLLFITAQYTCLVVFYLLLFCGMLCLTKNNHPRLGMQVLLCTLMENGSRVDSSCKMSA